MVSRYMRVRAVGSMIVLARAWVIPGHADLTTMGFAQGSDGNPDTPWGDTWGIAGVVRPPPGTRVLVRRFKIAWNNIGNEYDVNYRRAVDMAPNLQSSSEQVVSR